MLLTKRLGDRIYRYDKRTILNAKDGRTVNFEFVSRINYFVCYETSFQVLPNQNTVIGVDNQNRKRLLMEDISNVNPHYLPVTIGFLMNEINTILVNKQHSVLLVGDSGGKVVQYKFNLQSKVWTLQKNFGDLGIGMITSSARLDKLAVFGGDNCVRMVDMEQLTVVERPTKTAIQSVHSVKMCAVSGMKVYLTVAGVKPDYADSKTDLFNVSGLFKKKFMNNIQSNKKFLKMKTIVEENEESEVEELKDKLLKAEAFYKKELAHKQLVIDQQNALIKNLKRRSVSEFGEYSEVKKQFVETLHQRDLEIHSLKMRLEEMGEVKGERRMSIREDPKKVRHQTSIYSEGESVDEKEEVQVEEEETWGKKGKEKMEELEKICQKLKEENKELLARTEDLQKSLRNSLFEQELIKSRNETLKEKLKNTRVQKLLQKMQANCIKW